ncbi:hypothetical protein DYI37_17430 [Fulvimarina endophytica]|uniref:Integrase catalytic domain-containing protein n=1 Tax=Fulvimarina endophytica TaxID=2293836 RepID=A0A371WZ78_9HYPH|nr:hypothetical protein DYI37_17430 [Fulvimarina endophytica]
MSATGIWSRPEHDAATSHEGLNETLFSSLVHARAALALWRADHNTAGPHSQLGWNTPAEFAATLKPRRVLVLRSADCSAPPPAAHPGSPTAGNKLSAGKNLVATSQAIPSFVTSPSFRNGD